MEDLKVINCDTQQQLLDFVNSNNVIVKGIVKERFWTLFYKKYED
tara:strand:- start:3794 stop:3928 length:135 start_codon:yes stop_codon:yes gene_type:complete